MTDRNEVPDNSPLADSVSRYLEQRKRVERGLADDAWNRMVNAEVEADFLKNMLPEAGYMGSSN